MKRIAAALLCALALSCAGAKLTQENFEQVKDGMTTEQVKDLLGEPSKIDTASLPIVGTVTVYHYTTESSEATVMFHEDKVQMKAGSVAE